MSRPKPRKEVTASFLPDGLLIKVRTTASDERRGALTFLTESFIHAPRGKILTALRALLKKNKNEQADSDESA